MKLIGTSFIILGFLFIVILFVFFCLRSASTSFRLHIVDLVSKSLGLNYMGTKINHGFIQIEYNKIETATWKHIFDSEAFTWFKKNGEKRINIFIAHGLGEELIKQKAIQISELTTNSKPESVEVIATIKYVKP